jgi:hypothetical protein
MLTRAIDRGICLFGTAFIVAGNVLSPLASATHKGGSLLKSGLAGSEIGLSDTELPGPSPTIYAHPFYACKVNYYVSATGSDSHPGTLASPWQTLQHANNALPKGGKAAGNCINVEPGTYIAGVDLTAGGNYAGSNGYVVYRCMALDQCVINTVSHAFAIIGAPGANYIIIDGFDMVGNSTVYPHGVAYGAGVVVNTEWGPPQATPSAHHIWVLNNIIHGFGEAGVGTNEADWIFVLHNRVFGNANVTCDAQGSGIGLVVAKKTPNYTPTADDDIWLPFHQAVAKNITYDNILTQCGNAINPYDTDGNGIIIDTFNGAGVDNVLYPDETLVAWNTTYNNGGKGIQVFRTAYVTVANNTAYHNNLDPWNQGFPRGEINNLGGFNNRYYSNIVVAIPAASTSDPRCKGAHYDMQPAPCPLMANVAYLGGSVGIVGDQGNIWRHNISRGGNPPWGWGPDGNAMVNSDAQAFSCDDNKCNVNPQFVDVGRDSFSIEADSPAVNYGVTLIGEEAKGINSGACPVSIGPCP